ncbi:helix-turn-helix domain-containing protein [Streptomyces sp. NPDC004539]|uniref:winged helix-turn-helix transcriptional regulator n=1 Tax=Streptomyces sp. NPDC004539 TaxID=3154280 RepID=UPI0033B7ACD7
MDGDGDRGCPIGPVVDLMFSRWFTAILWALHHHGPLRFNELQRLLTGVTPKVLTARLRQLERDGLIVRTYYAEVPRRVEYQVSELGLSLSPIFRALDEWGVTHLPDIDAAREKYDRVQEEEAAWAEG